MSPLQSQVSLTYPQHISQSGAQGLVPRRLHTLGLCHCPVSARVWMSAEGSFPTITNLCLPQSLPSAKVTRLQALGPSLFTSCAPPWPRAVGSTKGRDNIYLVHPPPQQPDSG